MRIRFDLLFYFFLIFCFFSFSYVYSKTLFETINPKRFTEEDIELLGSYEKFDLPEGMMGKFQNKLVQSAERVLYRFVKKKRSLGQYPGKAIKAMAYFEVLYNELLNDPGFEVDLIKDINQGRGSFRSAFGFPLDLSITETTYRYWVLGELLDQGKVENIIIEKDLLDRKVLLRDFKNRIGNLRNQIEFDTSIQITKINQKAVKEKEKTEADSLYSGYCLRDNGTVYGTIYKNNCLTNKEISFEEYNNRLGNTFNQDSNKKELLPNENDQEISIENNLDTIEEKLIKLKRFYDEDLITKDEYDIKRTEILNAF